MCSLQHHHHHSLWLAGCSSRRDRTTIDPRPSACPPLSSPLKVNNRPHRLSTTRQPGSIMDAGRARVNTARLDKFPLMTSSLNPPPCHTPCRTPAGSNSAGEFPPFFLYGRPIFFSLFSPAPPSHCINRNCTTIPSLLKGSAFSFFFYIKMC